MDPELDVFNENEERLANMIRGQGESANTLAAVGVAIAGSFLLYQLYTKRRLQEETRDVVPNSGTLYDLVSRVFTSQWTKIAWTLVPSLISGYRLGLQEAALGEFSQDWLQSTAEAYAIELAESLHQTSAQALIEGYNTQVNRRVVARAALDRSIEAFGIAPRTMKSLVNVYVAPPVKGGDVLTSAPQPNRVKDRADQIIAKGIMQRAHDIGQTESHASKNQAKSIMWLYLQQNGQLPKDATKMWRTAKDERTCPVCAPLDKTQVPLDGKFTVSPGVEVWAPSLHPRCRCDIVLRGAITVNEIQDGMLEEAGARELAVAKNAWGVVSKAQGLDDFDRDRRGRFATTESRMRPDVAQLLSTVNTEAPTKTPIGRTAIAGKTSIGAKTAIGQKTIIGQLSPVAAPKTEVALGRTNVELQQLSLDAVKTQLNTVKTKVDTNKVKTPIARPVTEEEEANGWRQTPDGLPMYGVIGPLFEHRKGTILFSDDDTPWYTAGSRGYGIRTLEQGVSDFWRDQLTDASTHAMFQDMYEDMGEGGYLVVDGPQGQFYVDEEHFQQAWKAAVYQMPRALSETMWVPGLYGGAGDEEDIPVTASELADYLGLYEEADRQTPIVAITTKIHEDADGVWGGTMMQTGKFRVNSEKSLDQLYVEHMATGTSHSEFHNLGDLRFITVDVDPED